MEALIGLMFLVVMWLTIITVKICRQRSRIKALENNTKYYIREINSLKYGQEENEEGKTGETS